MGLGAPYHLAPELQIFHQQFAVAECFLRAAADDVGRLDDLVPDDQQDVAGTIVVVSLGLPMDRRELRLVRPRLRAFDGDALLFQGLNELVQILFRLFDDALRKGAARNFGQGAIRKFRQLSASIWRRKSRAQRIAYDDFLQRVPLIAAPYT